MAKVAQIGGVLFILAACDRGPVPICADGGSYDVVAVADSGADDVEGVADSAPVPNADDVEKCNYMANSYAECVRITTNPPLTAEQYDEIVRAGHDTCELNALAREQGVEKYDTCFTEGTVHLDVDGEPCLVICNQNAGLQQEILRCQYFTDLQAQCMRELRDPPVSEAIYLAIKEDGRKMCRSNESYRKYLSDGFETCAVSIETCLVECP